MFTWNWNDYPYGTKISSENRPILSSCQRSLRAWQEKNVFDDISKGKLTNSTNRPNQDDLPISLLVKCPSPCALYLCCDVILGMLLCIPSWIKETLDGECCNELKANFYRTYDYTLRYLCALFSFHFFYQKTVFRLLSHSARENENYASPLNH